MLQYMPRCAVAVRGCAVPSPRDAICGGTLAIAIAHTTFDAHSGGCMECMRAVTVAVRRVGFWDVGLSSASSAADGTLRLTRLIIPLCTFSLEAFSQCPP